MDADCGGKLGHLLDDRALAEDVGVEPGRFVGGAVAPAPTQAPTAAPTTTASKRPLPNTGIDASRLTALAILGLLTGAAVLHYRRKVTS